MQKVIHAVNGNLAHAVQAGNKGVAARFVGADLLPLVKGKEGDAHSAVLGQGLADHLPFLIGDLILQNQDFGLADVLHFGCHWGTSLIFLGLLSAPVCL